MDLVEVENMNQEALRAVFIKNAFRFRYCIIFYYDDKSNRKAFFNMLKICDYLNDDSFQELIHLYKDSVFLFNFLKGTLEYCHAAWLTFNSKCTECSLYTYNREQQKSNIALNYLHKETNIPEDVLNIIKEFTKESVKCYHKRW